MGSADGLGGRSQSGRDAASACDLLLRPAHRPLDPHDELA